MAVIANTNRETSLNKDVVTTVTVKTRITLDNLDIITKVAEELGIPKTARFTYNSENSYTETSIISYRYSVVKEVPRTLPKINKTPYEMAYGRKDTKPL